MKIQVAKDLKKDLINGLQCWINPSLRSYHPGSSTVFPLKISHPKRKGFQRAVDGRNPAPPCIQPCNQWEIHINWWSPDFFINNMWTSWWFQPICKICSSNWIISIPKFSDGLNLNKSFKATTTGRKKTSGLYFWWPELLLNSSHPRSSLLSWAAVWLTLLIHWQFFGENSWGSDSKKQHLCIDTNIFQRVLFEA